MVEPQLEPDIPFPHDTTRAAGLCQVEGSSTMYNRSFYDDQLYVWLFLNRREVSVNRYKLPVVQLEATIWTAVYKTEEEADALVRQALDFVTQTPLETMLRMPWIRA